MSLSIERPTSLLNTEALSTRRSYRTLCAQCLCVPNKVTWASQL